MNQGTSLILKGIPYHEDNTLNIQISNSIHVPGILYSVGHMTGVEVPEHWLPPTTSLKNGSSPWEI